jgi:hypothetical protein
MQEVNSDLGRRPEAWPLALGVEWSTLEGFGDRIEKDGSPPGSQSHTLGLLCLHKGALPHAWS